MQTEAALIEVAEETFQDHLSETDRDQTKTGGDFRDINKDGKTSATDKVVPCGKLPGPKSKKSNIDFTLGFVIPGECYELKKDIQNIFDKEYSKACHSSIIFQQLAHWSLVS